MHSFLPAALSVPLLILVLPPLSARAEIITLLMNCKFSATSTLAGTHTTLQVEYTYLSIAGIPSNDPRQSRYDLILSDAAGPFTRTTVQRSLSGQTYFAQGVALSLDPTRVDSQGHILGVYVDSRAPTALIADPALICTPATGQSGNQSPPKGAFMAGV